MSKQILQSVGDDTVAFGDQCYWVAEHVKRFLTSFQPGMEVDVTVKDVEGTPMVTFLKKAGFAPAQGSPKPYGGSPGGYQKPAYQPSAAPRPAAAPPAAPAASNDAMYVLAAAIISAYQLDPEHIKAIAAQLKVPLKPVVATPPPQPPAPVATAPAPAYVAPGEPAVDPITGIPY